MRTRHFWVQNGPFAPNNFFVKNLWTLFSDTYWPLSLWRTLKKNSYSGSTVMRMCHFLGHKWLTCQNQDFFRKPENNPCSFHSYLSRNIKWWSVKKILTIKEYWSLIGQETFSTITWGQGFSQTCRFHRMLMIHKNFRFTPILDKTNDMIFLKSPKLCFWAIFNHFWSFCPMGIFFQKTWLSHAQL